MRIHVAYFAGCREAVGKSQEEVTIAPSATVGDVLAWLETQYPGIKKIMPTTRVAVNREFVSEEHSLSDGDELVLIPPVSGGSGQRVKLSHEPIQTSAAEDLIETSQAGALATFVGVVRPTSKQGRAVTHLYYEAYEPMACEKLQQCLNEAAAREKILDAAVVHRLGHLTLGEVAVSIAVSSAHRKEAFAACSYIIDRIKEIVPIWKKETGPDGSEWVSEGA